MSRGPKSTYFITGGAGFIGSNLADRLLSQGHSVVVYDNFSTGQHEFIETALRQPDFRLLEGDVLDSAALSAAMHGADFVFHLAANADIRTGLEHPRRDLEQNTIATFNVLEAMRENEVSRIAFASSAAVLGEPTLFPTPEDCPIPIQTSLYGASKMACEGPCSPCWPARRARSRSSRATGLRCVGQHHFWGAESRVSPVTWELALKKIA